MSRELIADTDVKYLQGSLCRLDAEDGVQRDLHSRHIDLRFVDLPHTLVGIVSGEAYCQKVSNLKTTAINDKVSLGPPYLPLFSRNIDTAETRHSPFTCGIRRNHHRYSPISHLCPRSKIPYSATTTDDPRDINRRSWMVLETTLCCVLDRRSQLLQLHRQLSERRITRSSAEGQRRLIFRDAVVRL